MTIKLLSIRLLIKLIITKTLLFSLFRLNHANPSEYPNLRRLDYNPQCINNMKQPTSKDKGQAWATNHKHPHATSFTIDWSDAESKDVFHHVIACLMETKAPHHIPWSYQHTMNTDPDRWMIPMKAEMKTLKVKHTLDLVQLPPGVNIMDSMWIYDIKWMGKEIVFRIRQCL